MLRGRMLSGQNGHCGCDTIIITWSQFGISKTNVWRWGNRTSGGVQKCMCSEGMHMNTIGWRSGSVMRWVGEP